MDVSGRYAPVDDDESRARGDELCRWLRDYGERRINSRLIDERRMIPPYVVTDWGRRGIFGAQVETRYGGLGLRSREVARLLEQAAALDLSLGTFLLVCLFPGIRPIAAYGSDALKRELLPELAAGRVLAGYAQTEPGAGTHFPGMAARAEALAGGGFRLSGEKVWIGNGTWAGVLSAMAHEVDADGRRRGLVALAVPTDRPGVQLGRELLSMGMRGVVQSEVAFHDVHVEESYQLGAEAGGLQVGVDSMSWSRFSIAATCVGSMRRCVQLALRFAARRSIATGLVLEHPVIRGYLGESVAMVSAAEALLYRVAADIDAGRAVPAELFAVCKLAGAEFLWSVADRLVQVLGSRGYDESNEAPQILRDARVTRIFEGTSEALLAYLGGQVRNPRAGIHAYLRDALGAPALADRLAGAVAAVRGRAFEAPGAAGDAMPRSWESALLGRAAVFATLVAALDASAADATGRAAAWARERLDAALAHAAAAPAEERILLAPSELEKAVAGYVEVIGDVEQRLPGERRERDSLLRRDPPAA